MHCFNVIHSNFVYMLSNTTGHIHTNYTRTTFLCHSVLYAVNTTVNIHTCGGLGSSGKSEVL